MINILSRELRGVTIQVDRTVERRLNELGGVRSPEMKAVGSTLAKSIRKQLSVRGNGVPSAPGQPPHRQTGRLAKSVKAAPSGDAIKVGPLAFTSLFMEEGVNAVKGQGRATGSIEARARARRSLRVRSWVRKAKRTLRIAPRPFMDAALAAVQDQMVDVFVTKGSRHLEGT